MFRIAVSTWQHVIVYSLAITALSVAVPITVVTVALWNLPLSIIWPSLTIAALIPLFIAFPISIFALNIMRNMNIMVARIDDLVRYDGMTGLLNRSHFLHVVERERRENAVFAIVDADYFKKINDTHGHSCGDAALQYLSQQLAHVFGPYGFVGRLGGEEFGLYLPAVSLQQMKLLVAMLRTCLQNNPLIYDHTEIAISVSIGVAQDHKDLQISDVAKHADVCLYAAKAAGRDCCFYRNEVDEAVQLAA
jgi:diguanylate cyclase